MRVDCLKLTNMSAPVVVDYKESIGLDCLFDMEGEELYAVKWYKDENEFFRWARRKKFKTNISKSKVVVIYYVSGTCRISNPT